MIDKCIGVYVLPLSILLLLNLKILEWSDFISGIRGENCAYLYFIVPRNYEASLHPMYSTREYVQALNSVKLERVFAKPFLGSLDGHKDGISCLGKHPQSLSVMLSGACDGEVNRHCAFFCFAV